MYSKLVAVVKRWLARWLTIFADNMVCSSSLYLCSTCHLCVLEWSHYVCMSVCFLELLHTATSWVVSSIALAVLWGYHRLSECVCVCARFFSTRPVRVTVPVSVVASSRVSTPRSESENTSNIQSWAHQPFSLAQMTHTVVFSFTPHWFESLTDTSLSLIQSLCLHLSLSSLFYVFGRKAEWRLLGQDVKWTYRL